MSMMDTGQFNLTLDQLRALKTVLGQLNDGLVNQQQLIQKRGLDLPADSVQSFSVIQVELLQLERALADNAVELGQLRALVETTALVNSSLELDAVLSASMDEVIKHTGAERAFLLLRDEQTGALDLRIARDLEQQNGHVSGDKPQISRTIINDAITNGTSLLTDNAYKDPRMQGSETIAQYALRSVMCVPLYARGGVIGAIYVDNRLRSGVFTERELNLLTAFAHQVGAAIDNARLFASVRTLLAEITEMKDLMENVFASIGSGVITTDHADCILTFNNAAADILAHPMTQAIGQRIDTLLRGIDIDLTAYLTAVRTHSESYAVEAHLPIDGRGTRIINLKFSPLIDGDQMTQGVTMVLEDITEEREREEMVAHLRPYLAPGLLEKAPEIARLAQGGERRYMTCMFAEVCQLSYLTNSVPPGQLMQALNRYLEIATDTMHYAGGLIDKYMGSELMVLFNTQLNPQLNHALKAVEAALDLRDALLLMSRLPEQADLPPYYRIGIHSGVATLGNVGSKKRRNFTALGDTINLSKRLQENTVPGQIIISEDTLHAIEATGGLPAHIMLEEREPLQAKGRQQLTAIYEVFRA